MKVLRTILVVYLSLILGVHCEAKVVARLYAVSTRVYSTQMAGAAGGWTNMTLGLYVVGSQAKKGMVRAVGQGLVNVNMPATEALHSADPQFQGWVGVGFKVFKDAKTLDVNVPPPWSTPITGYADNLSTDAMVKMFNQVGMFGLTVGSSDSAIMYRTNPGVTTFQMEVVGDVPEGVNLGEFYDADPYNPNSKIGGLSTRGWSFPNNPGQTMIIGFVIVNVNDDPDPAKWLPINNDVPLKVLLEGAGPSLIPLGVSTASTDTTLTLYNGKGAIIASNDDWEQGPTLVPNVQDSGIVKAEPVTSWGVSAPLPKGAKDAVIVATLMPGAYTMFVTSKDPKPREVRGDIYEMP